MKFLFSDVKLERIPLTYRLSISYLVPNISALKEMQNGTKSGSPIVEILAKL